MRNDSKSVLHGYTKVGKQMCCPKPRGIRFYSLCSVS